jgi:hypothetical protein
MTDPAADADRDFYEVFNMLVSEREPVGTKLDVASLALLRSASRLMLSDDPRHARDLIELMKLCPPVVRRVVVDASVEELESRRPDLSVLSDDDLGQLHRIVSLARGLAQDAPRLTARRNAALAIARRLDLADFATMELSARNMLAQDVRVSIEQLLAPLQPSDVFSFADRSAEVRALEDRVAQLERDNHQLRMRAAGSLVSLSERRDAAAHAAAVVSAPAAPRTHFADHPDLGGA